MTRLILIRHGITEWNKEKRYCGHKDIGLSSEGKSQVRLLFNRLSSLGFDKVYCSDRKRAMQTARTLFKQTRIIPDRGLREINFGVLEGLRHEEIMEKYADTYKKWLKDPFKNNIPKAEPMNVFKKRVENTIWNIIRSNPNKTVAVVCHGGVIGIFVKGILKNKNFWRCVPSPASVTMVEYDKGKPKTRKSPSTITPGDFRSGMGKCFILSCTIKKFNDTAHLKVNNE